MSTFTILNFYPSKNTGNMLGFAGLQYYVRTDEGDIPQVTKVKIMRNGNTGHVFFAYHSEKYNDKEGNVKYNDLIRSQSKEGAEAMQRQFHKAWNEYVSKNASNPAPDSIGQPIDAGGYYPHGLCQKTQPIQNSLVSKNSKDEELPF